MVKICKKDKAAFRFFHEAELLTLFKHPNIIQLYGVCRPEPFYIVLEYMNRGCLLDYLYSIARNFKLPTLIHMSKQIVSGMAYLEAQKCVHCDITARNILVNEDKVTIACKISGFELAFTEDNIKKYDDALFPLRWTAPEALLYGRFSIKSDVWSFGIVLYEVITRGELPYSAMKNAEVKESLSTKSYRMPCPPKCPDKLYKIMLNCWSEEPSSRPKFCTLQTMLNEYF